ncbi:alpha/beta hydrolase [Pseudomonas sp. KSR10]|uniref:alpha/beta fold hydrolase n=1 Tax=Pseudomonas sp. KSR10 TaxID=2916654 RepID=UPI001EF96D9F|nr:alpha/beta hydrolase [Pseudomonas sp. KSR10]MCG6540699.1 alpha/beta hydrolase [Pseudomonas sp. KSR10]
MLRQIEAGVLRVAYFDSGPSDGTPVLLLHGFPYDVHAYDQVAPILVSQGCRVLVPYLRGYGPTQFLYPDTPRSGQQAVLAHDLLAFLDSLKISTAVLAGYDWGGRAACIVAALWPERVRALVSAGGYNIQDIPGSVKPQIPENECRYWYQYYFHSERGRAGLIDNRRELCRLLWRQWSPTWTFTDEDFNQTADSFENPDFADVVIHSYRHRYGLVPGDPTVEETERRLTTLPRISVPSITLDGLDDGVAPLGGSASHLHFFTGHYEHRAIPGVGHNLPQEAPHEFAQAVLSLINEHDGKGSKP